MHSDKNVHFFLLSSISRYTKKYAKLRINIRICKKILTIGNFFLLLTHKKSDDD